MIGAHWLGATRHDLEACASTNDEAERLARAGAPHGTVVTAARQTAGRGRADHTWHSPDADNLYISCVLRPGLVMPAGKPDSNAPSTDGRPGGSDVERSRRRVPASGLRPTMPTGVRQECRTPVRAADVVPITLAAGIGVCDAVNSWGARASLKWPNDVLVMGRKIAGILTEMSSRGSAVEHVVLGVGVNVNMDGAGFPPELADTAISLRTALGGRRVDRAAFTDELLARLERWLDRFFAGGIAAISAPWTERSQLAGRRLHTDVATGVARGLDRDGALLVEDDRGTVHRVVAGDVVLL